ncbi:unnamed protein product [Allacma fusca]|uniref:C2 domain-containing protein n=1 Tax=Allacma fusca TaxID=39272 RepID=A0A8J2PIY5_9HEXA|nr:unnamed protein product [Allacma fusca]
MMSFENQSTLRSMEINTPPSSLPTTPSFVRKFHSNFRPLDLRKLTLYGSHTEADHSSSSSQSCGSSQDNSPKARNFGSCQSHDSFLLKRQSSQTRLRESLLTSLLSPRTKEIEFTVPQTLSPLTPTFTRKGITSGESSPGSLSGSRSETEPSNSRANTPSPIFFRGSGADISDGSCMGGLNPELYKSRPENEEEEGVEYPENHYGRVWYALEYETTSERLLLTLIKARNLEDRHDQRTSTSSTNTTGLAKPLPPSSSAYCKVFVRVSLFPDERRTLQSKPKKLSRHPQFEETFGFQISKAGLVERSLKLCVYDVDSNKKTSMLGYVIQPLKDIDWSFGKQVFKEDLLRDSGELSPNIGEVLVSLCYNASISRLTVNVLESKGIKSRESASGVYAKVSLTQHTKIVKTKKTSTVALLGCRASFNESFNFKLGMEMLDTASVSIQLMYAQPGYNKDQNAGRLVLGSFMFARGKGLDHWTEMLSKQKEQIQYWHAISE